METTCFSFLKIFLNQQRIHEFSLLASVSSHTIMEFTCANSLRKQRFFRQIVYETQLWVVLHPARTRMSFAVVIVPQPVLDAPVLDLLYFVWVRFFLEVSNFLLFFL